MRLTSRQVSPVAGIRTLCRHPLCDIIRKAAAHAIYGMSERSWGCVLTVDAAKLPKELCARLGYCLPPEDQQRFVADPPTRRRRL